MVWACGGWEDDGFSVFSPEAFVAPQYTPFFYDGSNWYYGRQIEVEDNNNRFNSQVVDEWDNYLNHQLSKPALQYILLHSSKAGADSVYDYITGKNPYLKPDSLRINIAAPNKKKIGNLFKYLDLARQCETFAVAAPRDWYSEPTPTPPAPPLLEKSLSAAFNNSKDPFIKQRLWFQLVRYYFFNDDTTKDEKEPPNNPAKILSVFNVYKSVFPQNLTYYRTLGYIAGYHRRKGNFALANYLYSRCYDYCLEMKIPSKFSFHAQQESDWQETLALAKNKEEKITLWHMLGMEYDESRAIKEIMKLDPKSDKAELLLSRMVNEWEVADSSAHYGNATPQHNIIKTDIKLVDSIALRKNTAKPYYWSIAAGYLHYIDDDYKNARYFYAIAKKQLPPNNILVTAQYKVLTLLLDLVTRKTIDAKEEAKLVEPLTWLKYMKEGTGYDVRFAIARGICTNMIATAYRNQGNLLKATCFGDGGDFYASNYRVQQLINLLNKPDKTPFEKVMTAYYSHNVKDLYYLQALNLVYKDNIDEAVGLMNKANDTSSFAANPFNGRIKDCHDCDAAAPQKHKFNSISFVKALQNIKAQIKAGKNLYQNTLLLANAYYNITYYGNTRSFYESAIYIPETFTSQQLARKYYKLAGAYAKTDEQRAKYTFMIAKCDQNESYEFPENNYNNDNNEAVIGDTIARKRYFADFATLKEKYNNTKFYKEILHECGYFKDYVNPKK